MVAALGGVPDQLPPTARLLRPGLSAGSAPCGIRARDPQATGSPRSRRITPCPLPAQCQAGAIVSAKPIEEFLRFAGLEDVDDDWVRQSGLIEWREGGPDVWEH
ncbi:hypothetical protein GCM10027073_68190 [Streptomyces chlorus]